MKEKDDYNDMSKYINSPKFNIFEFRKKSNGHELTELSYLVMQNLDYFNILKINDKKWVD